METVGVTINRDQWLDEFCCVSLQLSRYIITELCIRINCTSSTSFIYLVLVTLLKMLLSVGRLVSLRRLSYVSVSAFDLVPCGPTFVTPTALLKTTVEPLCADDRLLRASNLRDTIWPAFARSRFSPCIGGFLSKRGLWSCQGGRTLFPFNEIAPGRCLHQKVDDKVEARDSNDVGAKVETETEAAQPAKGKLSQRERLKRAVREYGATVIVFHTCISLFTLGVSYAVVSR